MITIIVQSVITGTKKERVKALLFSLAIDSIVLLASLPFSDLITYTR